jgi:hypothetical protein
MFRLIITAVIGEAVDTQAYFMLQRQRGLYFTFKQKTWSAVPQKRPKVRKCAMAKLNFETSVYIV